MVSTRLRKRARYYPNEEVAGFDISNRIFQWFNDVAEVLDRPTIAIALFVMGVFFIVLASKQVKLVFEYMEKFGFGERPRDGWLGNFMAVLVFLFVWVDVVFLTMLKNWAIRFSSWMYKYYLKLLAALEDIQAYEEIESLRRSRRRS